MAMAALVACPLLEKLMQGTLFIVVLFPLAKMVKLVVPLVGVKFVEGRFCPAEILKGFLVSELYVEVSSSEKTAPFGNSSQSLAIVQVFAPLLE